MGNFGEPTSVRAGGFPVGVHDLMVAGILGADTIMTWWILCILGGIVGTAMGIVAGIFAFYGYYWLRGVTEHEGKRGLLAGSMGILCGVPLGFYSGFKFVAWMLSGTD
jgi:hypothetical protein